MARALLARVPGGVAEDVVAERQVAAVEERDELETVHEEVESSARLVTALPIAPKRPVPELVAMPARVLAEQPMVPDEAPRYTSRNLRAEAWDRERERGLRSVERQADGPVRRRSGS
jgi:hypothetical protein